MEVGWSLRGGGRVEVESGGWWCRLGVQVEGGRLGGV